MTIVIKSGDVSNGHLFSMETQIGMARVEHVWGVDCVRYNAAQPRTTSLDRNCDAVRRALKWNARFAVNIATFHPASGLTTKE